MHTIDFETCANNYQSEHNGASRYCIGERKIDESYFIFYTSGAKTKIVFDKMYVSNFFAITFFQAIKIFVFLVCRTTSTKRNTLHVTFLKITLLLVVLTSTYTPFGRSFALKNHNKSTRQIVVLYAFQALTSLYYSKTWIKQVPRRLVIPFRHLFFAILGPKIHITFGISLLSKERGNFASNRIWTFKN